MSKVSGVRLAGLLLAIGLPSFVSAGQGPTVYADAVAKYQNRQVAQAIELLKTLSERRMSDEAERFRREGVRDAEKWLPRARAAILLHTETWFGQGAVGLKEARNPQFDSAHTIVRLLTRVATELGPLHANPEFVRDWYLLVVDFLHGQANVGRSRAILEEARKLFPSDSMVMLASGADHEMLSFLSTGYLQYYDTSGVRKATERLDVAKELEQAARFYREALKHDPHLVEARLRLGHVLYRLGQTDAAAVDLDFARLTTNQAHLRYLANVFLGMIEGARGRRARAAELYDEAMRIYPDNQTALLGLSELAYLEGRLTDAASIITRTLRQNKKQDPWWGYLSGDWWHFEARLKSIRVRAQS